jgi:hypothetical protein
MPGESLKMAIKFQGLSKTLKEVILNQQKVHNILQYDNHNG